MAIMLSPCDFARTREQLGQLIERHTLIEACVLRQLQNFLGDLVAHDLIGAAAKTDASPATSIGRGRSPGGIRRK